MAEDQIEVACPGCGAMIPVPRTAARRAVTPDPQRRARMAWSNKTGRFSRQMMTDAEWQQYRRKGSID